MAEQKNLGADSQTRALELAKDIVGDFWIFARVKTGDANISFLNTGYKKFEALTIEYAGLVHKVQQTLLSGAQR